MSEYILLPRARAALGARANRYLADLSLEPDEEVVAISLPFSINSPLPLPYGGTYISSSMLYIGVSLSISELYLLISTYRIKNRI